MLQNNGSSGGGWATVAENAGHINYFRNRHSVRARPEKRIVGLRAKLMHLAKRLLWALQHIVSSMMEKTARKKNIILNWMRSSEETMSNRRWLTMSAHDSRNNRKLTIFVFFFHVHVQSGWGVCVYICLWTTARRCAVRRFVWLSSLVVQHTFIFLLLYSVVFLLPL